MYFRAAWLARPRGTTLSSVSFVSLLATRDLELTYENGATWLGKSTDPHMPILSESTAARHLGGYASKAAASSLSRIPIPIWKHYTDTFADIRQCGFFFCFTTNPSGSHLGSRFASTTQPCSSLSAKLSVTGHSILLLHSSRESADGDGLYLMYAAGDEVLHCTCPCFEALALKGRYYDFSHFECCFIDL
jgi:hypothetical protein